MMCLIILMKKAGEDGWNSDCKFCIENKPELEAEIEWKNVH